MTASRRSDSKDLVANLHHHNQEPATKKKTNSTFEQSIDPRNRTVNIDALKSFAFQNFPKGSPIRNVLAEERSILTVPEFLAKLETWQALLRSI